jgi:hypothetical protein
MASATQLEEALNQPDRSGRLRALRELKALADAGAIRTEPPRPWVNMHCHSFHSYNAHGFSPSRIAWEAHRRGLAAAGVVDFDVLDGLDETLAASDALRSKLTMGIETRVYVQDFARDVINSPNEPGICYFMGQGFVQAPPAGTPAARTLQRMKECAVIRNRAVMENVNRFLGEVTVDYARDVLPLTASGNATERHLLLAYDLQAQKVMPDRARRSKFWAAKIQMSEPEVAAVMNDPVRFRDTLRKRLMKYGAPGYAAPDPKNFPTLAEVVEMIRACGAMPISTWLDGLSTGEQDTELLLDYYSSAGQVGVNFIPDRNWNLRDPAEKALKLAKFNEALAAARNRHLIACVGTEMNSAGQPLVDHFDAPELKPHVPVFLEGAQIMWGHSLLLRHGGFGYLSPQAEAAFSRDVARKNAFFRQVGEQPVPHGRRLQALRTASRAGDCKAVLQALQADR